MRTRSRHVLLMLTSLAVAVLFASPHVSASATLKTLHAFCAKGGCADGAEPRGELLMDSTGNLYGTSIEGIHDGGNVFALMLDPATGKRKFKVLYDFCAQALCADGAAPFGALIIDVDGNLYGTTSQGGNSQTDGTVFELMPNADRSKWNLKTLYKFCSLDGCADGQTPAAGLTYSGAAAGALYDGHSPLYGTTPNGGLPLDAGTVFQLTRVGKIWSETVIHDFCSDDHCDDGIGPYAPVIADASGHLFGTTLNGGHLNRGVAFELAPEDIGWTFTTLYDFCQLSQCADGSGPAAPLVMDASGNLFGTTNGGGNASGQGVMFKLVPNGIKSQETVLYSFCALADCTDGASPQSGLVLGANGDLFGTTANGGAHSPFGGTVFRLRGTHYKVLYSFCAESNCGDGTEIDDGLVIDASGTLFGVAAYGGAHGEGSAFQLRPARH